MSDKMRWRYGDANPVMAAVKSDTVIEIGDLVYLDYDNAKPASEIDLYGFAENFLGVAMQRSHPGDTNEIRVATTGVFEFDCVSDVYERGNLVCPAGSLLNHKVRIAPTAGLSIARVTKRATTSANSILIDICSTVMRGGTR